ncbi:MAG: hypothetical protein ABSG13_22015 [Bryobacteraceae bacterium]|jgi:hypothetical protein
MALFHYLPRQVIDVLAALGEDAQPVVAIQDGSIFPNLQRALLAGSEREF